MSCITSGHVGLSNYSAMAIQHQLLEMPEPVPVEGPIGWRLSTLALVAANAVPLVGVLVFHWTVFPILLLYWCENVVVGAFNVLRMLCVQPDQPVMWAAKAFMIPFFAVHYGGFALVHGLFVMTMFSGNGVGKADPRLVLHTISQANLWYGIAALILSHGISFVHNFLMGGEYRRTSLSQLMTRPYARVMVLHITILGGGFLVMALHSALPALVVLIVLKTGIDLAAHNAERKTLASTPVRGALAVVPVT